MAHRTATSLPYTELEVAGPYDPTTQQGNYDVSRAPIDMIVIHTMVGSAEAAAARFDDPSSKVSAHYGVKLDGSLIHWLEEYYTAYHAGDYFTNQRSIGIEHEDNWNGQPPEPTRPDALYTTSANLVRDICQFYSIPIDRDHIKKHNEVSDNPTGCPDSLDIDRIVREAAHPPDDCQNQLAAANKLKDQFYNDLQTAKHQISDLQEEVGDLTSKLQACLSNTPSKPDSNSAVSPSSSTISVPISYPKSQTPLIVPKPQTGNTKNNTLNTWQRLKKLIVDFLNN